MTQEAARTEAPAKQANKKSARSVARITRHHEGHRSKTGEEKKGKYEAKNTRGGKGRKKKGQAGAEEAINRMIEKTDERI